MVRVPVAADGIIGDDHIRTVPTDKVHQLAYHVFGMRLHKSLAIMVAVPACHPRIVIAELVHPGNPQNGRRLRQFCLAYPRQALPVCRVLMRVEPYVRNVDLAEFPIRTGDDNGGMSLLCR